jgi:hypothetical protein
LIALEEEMEEKTTLKVTRVRLSKSAFFMDTSGLTGSDLEDKIIARRLVIFLYD